MACGYCTTTSPFKPKDMVPIPWMVAMALRDDGWWLRQDIVWSKPNPMPESVTDRPTKAHEYLFLLSKSERYYFDQEPVRLPISPHNTGRVSVAPHGAHVMNEGHRKNEIRQYEEIKGANIRTVWTIPSEPFPGAHFAVMPTALVKPCILAGCPTGGTVLDPFGGSGTVAVVALEHGCSAVLCELNPAYCEIIRQRVGNVTPAMLLVNPAPRGAREVGS